MHPPCATGPHQQARALLPSTCSRALHTAMRGRPNLPHAHALSSRSTHLAYTVTVSGAHHSCQQPARRGQVLLEVAEFVCYHEAFAHQVDLALLHARHRRAALEVLRAHGGAVCGWGSGWPRQMSVRTWLISSPPYPVRIASSARGSTMFIPLWACHIVGFLSAHQELRASRCSPALQNPQSRLP